jgi:hypothetical protein
MATVTIDDVGKLAKIIVDCITIIGVFVALYVYRQKIHYQRFFQRLSGVVTARRLTLQNHFVEIEFEIKNEADVRIEFSEIVFVWWVAGSPKPNPQPDPTPFPKNLESTQQDGTMRYAVDAKSQIMLNKTIQVPDATTAIVVRAMFVPKLTSDKYIIERTISLDQPPP